MARKCEFVLHILFRFCLPEQRTNLATVTHFNDQFRVTNIDAYGYRKSVFKTVWERFRAYCKGIRASVS